MTPLVLGPMSSQWWWYSGDPAPSVWISPIRGVSQVILHNLTTVSFIKGWHPPITEYYSTTDLTLTRNIVRNVLQNHVVAPFYAPHSGVGTIESLWQMTAKSSTTTLGVTAKPFSHSWRCDIAGDAVWQGKPVSDVSLSDFAVTPFAVGWHYDVKPDPDWLGEPISDIVLIATATQPFFQEWRYDNVPEPPWLGTPTAAVAIDVLSVFAPVGYGQWQWQFDNIESPPWTPGAIPSPVRDIATALARPLFYVPRLGIAESVWQGAPYIALSMAIPSTVKPFYQQWRWDHVPEPFWPAASEASVILTDLAAVPFSKLWTYNVAVEAVWQGAPGPAAIVTDLARRPFSKLWRYDFAVGADLWQGAPQIAASLVDLGRQPFALGWHYDFAVEAVWQGSPEPSVVIADISAVPFSKLWRWDHVHEPVWQTSSQASVILSDFATKPFATQWRWDHVPEPFWQTSSEPSIILSDFAAKPFAKLWRWDHVPEPFWQGAPEAAITLADLAHKPFWKGWHYDFVPDPNWAWTPPNTSIDQTSVNPVHKLWRYDFAVEAVWQGNPEASVIIIDLATEPFSKLWRWDHVPEPVWQTSSEPSVILTDLSTQPFNRLWRYDVVFETVWQGNPLSDVVLADFYVTPFAKGWHYDFVAEPVWQTSAQSAIIAQQLAVTPFAKGWHYDVVFETVWQCHPTASPAMADFYVSPFSQSWHYDFVPDPNWAWTVPNVTVVEPPPPPYLNFRLLLSKILWRNDFVAEPPQTLGPVASPVMADLYVTPFNRQWRWDHVPEPYWMGNPIADVLLSDLAGQPFAKGWHYDIVIETSWQSHPTGAPVLAYYVTEPFSLLWRWDHIPEPSWARSVPNATLALAPVIPAAWHYNAAEETPWSGAPAFATIVYNLAGSPFAKKWRYDQFDFLAWAWAAPSANIIEPVIGPFHNKWRYDLVPDGIRLGTPLQATSLVFAEFFALFSGHATRIAGRDYADQPAWAWTHQPSSALKGSPSHNLAWQFAQGPEPSIWQGGAAQSVTLSELAGKPFARLWRNDLAEATSWIWEPPSQILSDLSVVLAPFSSHWSAGLNWQDVVQPWVAPANQVVSFGPFVAPIWGTGGALQETVPYWRVPANVVIKPSPFIPSLVSRWTAWQDAIQPWVAPPNTVLASVPFHTRWISVPYETIWQGSPAASLTLLELYKYAAAREWRYDLGEAAIWQMLPAALPGALAPQAVERQFAWALWGGPIPQVDPSWAWAAPNTTVIIPPPGPMPFIPVWRFDTAPEWPLYGPAASILMRRICIGLGPPLIYPRSVPSLIYPPDIVVRLF